MFSLSYYCNQAEKKTLFHNVHCSLFAVSVISRVEYKCAKGVDVMWFDFV